MINFLFYFPPNFIELDQFLACLDFIFDQFKFTDETQTKVKNMYYMNDFFR